MSEDDYHDPTAGIGGAPPARSALTLRLLLAIFGLVVMAGLGALALVKHSGALAVVAFVIAATALVDIVVILRRRAANRSRAQSQ
jgi:hypothetical protein